MKKWIIVLCLAVMSTVSVYASDVIPTLEEGMVLKCDAVKESGTIKEFSSFTDYYTVRGGKIYSGNLSKMFGNPNYERKVLRLKITDDTIKFKDRLYRWKACYYKWVTIDKHTGEYTFKARRTRTGCGGYYQSAKGTGKCVVIKK